MYKYYSRALGEDVMSGAYGTGGPKSWPAPESDAEEVAIKLVRNWVGDNRSVDPRAIVDIVRSFIDVVTPHLKVPLK